MAVTPSPARHGAAVPAPVAVLRWPEQDDERRRLAALGRPRVLLTRAGVTPSSILDENEVWVREGSSASSLLEAMEQLGSTTAGTLGGPYLDDDHLLRFEDKWVAIPPALRRLTRLFLDNYLTPVSRDTMREVYRRAGHETSPSSLSGLIYRLDVRVATVGLELHRIYHRGLLLGPAGPMSS
jgi:hypothetical protein